MSICSGFSEEQTPLSCQLCEETLEIKWKCLKCELYMCSRCQKIHTKIRSNDEHKIVDIKDIDNESDARENDPDFTNIKCKYHEGQTCCLFCKDCEQVVCPLCISTTHNTHKMTGISDGHEFAISKITSTISKLQNHRAKLDSGVSMLDGTISTETYKYETEKQKILSQDRSLKDAVDKHTDKLLNELDNSWIVMNKSVTDEQSLLVEVSKDIDNMTLILQEVLESNNPKEVFTAVEQQKMYQITKQNPLNIEHKIPKFVQGDITQSAIESIHGVFNDAETEPDFTVVDEYKTKLPWIDNILCCRDESIWINCYGARTMQNISLSHNALHVNQSIKLPVFNLALTTNGDVLISTFQTALQTLPTENLTGRVAKFCVSPLTTTAVHVSKDHKVIVGAKEPGPAIPVNGPRKIIVMNLDGKLEKVYDEVNNEPIFTYPHRITTDDQGNMFIIDWVSDNNKGRIVVLKPSGAVTGIYNGNPQINNSDNPFTPTDLVTTKSKVIVTDRENHVLHILNSEGECIRYKNLRELGIHLPFSLDINYQGLLYIGCGTYRNQPDEAKVHVVKMIGL